MVFPIARFLPVKKSLTPELSGDILFDQTRSLICSPGTHRYEYKYGMLPFAALYHYYSNSHGKLLQISLIYILLRITIPGTSSHEGC